jgi:hypothetical protein
MCGVYDYIAMKEIFSKIKIIPIKDILLHEGVVAEWIQKLSAHIDYDGIVKNPIIVTRYQGRYIALDGMHRVSALKALGCRDIVVYEVDYDDPSISLFGWDGLILDPCPLPDSLSEFADREGLELSRHADFPRAQASIRKHGSCFCLLTRDNEVFELCLAEKSRGLDPLIRALKSFEADLDKRKQRVIYVADDHSEKTFRQHENAWALFKRPFFTKEEVVQRTFQGKTPAHRHRLHSIKGRHRSGNEKQAPPGAAHLVPREQHGPLLPGVGADPLGLIPRPYLFTLALPCHALHTCSSSAGWA